MKTLKMLTPEERATWAGWLAFELPVQWTFRPDDDYWTDWDYVNDDGLNNPKDGPLLARVSPKIILRLRP